MTASRGEDPEPAPPGDGGPPPQRDDLPAVAADLVAVLLFALVGRASHGQDLAAREVALTALPFAVACLAAHVGIRLARRDARAVAAGVVVWLTTWLAGMALRLLLGNDAAAPFVLVAGGLLLLGVVGWRVGWALAGRRRR